MVLAGQDGHVAVIAATARHRDDLTVTARLLTALGVTGWSLTDMTLADAVIAMAGYYDCPDCTMQLGCGCSVQFAARGMCPHGGDDLIHAAWERLTR